MEVLMLIITGVELVRVRDDTPPAGLKIRNKGLGFKYEQISRQPNGLSRNVTKRQIVTNRHN